MGAPPNGRSNRKHDAARTRMLEGAIDEIAASYQGNLEIDNLESAALPNKRAVIEAFEQIKASMFMGFFSTRALHHGNLRQALAEHLYPAYCSLVEQIERAIQYDHWMGRTCALAPSGSGDDVLLALFTQLPELRRILNSDVQAAYEGDPAAKDVEEIVFSYPSIEAIVAYRIANRLSVAGVPMIPRIITEYAHSRTGIDISPAATIGESFFIDHGTGVVIGETSVIGNNVKLYQGVTLGALSIPRRDKAGAKRHPTLEDGVTIYAGATILGGETVIGAGSVVGGNVWLTRSVPPGSKVFGRGRAERSGESQLPPLPSSPELLVPSVDEGD